VHARSVSSEIKGDINGDSGDKDHDNALSPKRTHGRTIFADEPENGDERRTMHATVRNIVRPERMDSSQLRVLVRDLIDRYPLSPYSTLWQASGLDHDRADWETFVSLVVEEREAAA